MNIGSITSGEIAFYAGVALVVAGALAALVVYIRKADELSDELERCKADLDRTTQTMFEKNTELMETNERLNEVGETQKVFMDIFAHQLRTPLSAIKWSAEALAQNATKEDVAYYAESIQERVAAIHRFANSILQVAELAESESTIDIPVEHSLSTYLEECVSTWEERYEHSGVTLSKQIEEVLPPVRTHRDLLKVALDNLLENAQWYSKEGDTVWVRAYAQDGAVVLEVEDSGIGVSEKERKRITQKFYRSERAKSAHPDGSGLGLYITRKIIDMHNATMTFDSTEGEGSTFRITLPIADGAEPTTLTTKTRAA